MGTPSPSHSRLMKLQELILDGADISDDAMFHLSKLPELRSLSLMACVRLTADGLGKLVSEASQGPLDGSLNLSNCSGLQGYTSNTFFSFEYKSSGCSTSSTRIPRKRNEINSNFGNW